MTYVDQLTVSEARARLPELLDRIERGEEITITRHGRPAAVMLRPDAVRVRRGESTIARARDIGRMLEEARHRPLGPPTLDAEYAEELIREIRAGRDDD
jgi:antitoxin (DNA-binding transcriptional repressor) of toxin-antitoxin stability system